MAALATPCIAGLWVPTAGWRKSLSMKPRLRSAQALPESGRLVACDRDPDSLAIARRTWDAAGVGHKVGQHASTAHAQHGCMCLASGMRVGPGHCALLCIDGLVLAHTVGI